MAADSPTEVEAYHTGVLQGIVLAGTDPGKPKSIHPTLTRNGGDIDISLELNRERIFEQFGDAIDERTSAAYGFDLNRIEGENHEEKLRNLLVKIVTLLKGIRCKKHISLSIFLEPTALDWCGSSGPAICLYLGSSDEELDKSNIDKLNRRIMKMKSYVSAESAPPEEDAPFIGFYSPNDKTLYLPKELQLSWDIANEAAPWNFRR